MAMSSGSIYKTPYHVCIWHVRISNIVTLSTWLPGHSQHHSELLNSDFQNSNRLHPCLRLTSKSQLPYSVIWNTWTELVGRHSTQAEANVQTTPNSKLQIPNSKLQTPNSKLQLSGAVHTLLKTVLKGQLSWENQQNSEVGQGRNKVDMNIPVLILCLMPVFCISCIHCIGLWQDGAKEAVLWFGSIGQWIHEIGLFCHLITSNFGTYTVLYYQWIHLITVGYFFLCLW